MNFLTLDATKPGGHRAQLQNTLSSKQMLNLIVLICNRYELAVPALALFILVGVLS